MLKTLFILFILLFPFWLVAQSEKEKSDEHLKEQVYGVVISGNVYYLITDKGYLKVSEVTDDPWLDYYKKVYGDSIDYNPNTIIIPSEKEYWTFRYFNPIIPIHDWVDEKWGFGKNMFLYDFIKVDKDGNYSFRPGVMGIIMDSNKIPDVYLPVEK
ncbi:hypothetical protein BMS3Abin03_01987 [bacterium BMS3Abin03]|nr:hypothetical protein BMS3Abin03_01987 [bacterium BMS3Abin03]